MASTQNTETQPHPTQLAFEPATSKDIWQGVGTVLLCLIGFGLGLAAWFDASIAEMLWQSVGQSQTSGWWLMFVFPIFLPAAGYFAYTTWRRWRNTRIFEQSKQTITGVITHLWVDPPRPPGKRYYVGYQFGQGHSAYQQVHARTHSRLTIGEEVTVEYSQAQPQLSHLNLKTSRRKK